MKLIAKYHTTDYRGDHSADVCELHDIAEGETVEQLAGRLFDEPSSVDPYRNWIEIRLVSRVRQP